MSFQVLTGRLPFEASAAVELMYQHLNKAPPLPSSVLPSLGTIFDGPIQRMLAKDLDERPPTAGEAVDELVAAAAKAGHHISTGAMVLPRTTPLARTPGSLPAELAETSPSVHSVKKPSMVPGLRKVASGKPLTSLPPVTAPARPGNISSHDTTEKAGPSPGQRLKWVAALALAAGLIAGGTIFWLRGSAPGPVPPPVVATPVPPPPVTPTPPPVEPEKPPPFEVARRVVVTVHSPVKAMVFLGADRLGLTDELLSLPWGKQVVTLTVKAPGYLPSSVDLVPDEDREAVAALKRAPQKLNKDLENPF